MKPESAARHSLLARQLRALGLDADTPPTPKAWRQLLARVGNAYRQADEDRGRLRDSEERHRSVVEGVQEVIFQVGPSGTWTFLNRAWRELTGFDVAESLGRDAFGGVHPKDRPGVRAAFEALTGGREERRVLEARYLTRDGQVRWAEVHARPLRDPAGRVTGVGGTLNDIDDRKRAEHELRETKELYRGILYHMREGFYRCTPDGRLLWANPAFARLHGYADGDELRAASPCSRAWYVEPGRRDELLRLLEAEGQALDFESEVHHLRGDGRLWVSENVRAVRDDSGGLLHYEGSVQDVTGRRRAARALGEQKAFYEGILGRLPVEVVALDPAGRYLYCNPTAIRDPGVRGWIIGHTDREYAAHRGFDPELALRREGHFREAVEGGRPVAWEETFGEADGAPRHHLRHLSPVFGAGGRLELVLGYGLDITERRAAQEALVRLNGELERRVAERTEELRRLNDQLQHDAFHDALTRLPNRALLRDRLGQAVERYHRRPGGGFAVLLLDFDRFKGINDSLGHTAGDALLATLAGRLRGCVRPLDTVARMGGDEFVVLLEEVDPGQALRTVERVQRALGTPLPLGGQDVQMSASIGVVFADPTHTGPEDVLRDADIAMDRAKARGRAGHQVFTAEMRAEALDLITLERDLRAAVRGGELAVEYQPIVDLDSGEPEGFEALVRWTHPTLGPVSPARFIPVAEESGLILDLDRWVLREACTRMQAWRRQIPGLAPLSLSVNFSGQQFAQPDLCARVEETLRETGFDPHLLRIEMTESVLVQDSAATRANLDGLRALGIGLHLDDFGTGYSSLGYLQQHPVNVIKIDRSFITRMSASPESAELVRTMIGMARHLGLRVVAEGVESSGQLDALRGLGCDYGQGYLFSRPLGAGAALRFLQGEGGREPAPDRESVG